MLYNKNLTKALRGWCDEKASDILHRIQRCSNFDIWNYVDDGIDAQEGYDVAEEDRQTLQLYMIMYLEYQYPDYFRVDDYDYNFDDVINSVDWTSTRDLIDGARSMLNSDLGTNLDYCLGWVSL